MSIENLRDAVRDGEYLRVEDDSEKILSALWLPQRLPQRRQRQKKLMRIIR